MQKKSEFQIILSLLTVFLCTSFASASNRSFMIEESATNQVVFISRAPGETFDGKTGNISGWLKFDPQDLSAQAEGKITVDVKSLDTGNKLRNTHMFDNHLHPDKFPVIEFEFKEFIDPVKSLPEGIETILKVKGKFTLHGVTRDKEIEVKAILNGSTLNIETDFTVSLQEYDVPRPEFLFLKLADLQEIKVKFKANSK